MELSKKERLILYNQYEILKCLDPESRVDCEINQEILFNGYHEQYDSFIEYFSDDLDDSISKFVWDVLQMYRIMNYSYDQLTPDDREKIDLYDITFHGFDGNEEGKYYLFASFVIEKLKRFEELTEMKGFELNSHYNSLEKYNSMLNRWFEVSNNRNSLLSFNDLMKIINKN